MSNVAIKADEGRENDVNADGERELQARKQHGAHGGLPLGSTRVGRVNLAAIGCAGNVRACGALMQS